MKILRFLVAVVVFVIVWIVVAVFLAFATRAVFPGTSGNIPILGVHWASLPGSVLGVLAGYRVYHLLGGDRQRI
jgi:hypothetical protein